MSNPLYQMMGQQMPQNGLLQRFQQFQQMFRGDPRQSFSVVEGMEVEACLKDSEGKRLQALPLTTLSVVEHSSASFLSRQESHIGPFHEVFYDLFLTANVSVVHFFGLDCARGLCDAVQR